ncbi:MAG: ABC transporter ATP-binding protein, partial [Deltaproteobacteria bacterium]|nr:ABC transporter ATP-binding protein [Deltaproteobacteria bacterium]
SAISLKEIYKTYKKGLRQKILAVKNLSFAVEQGEIFGFVGPNGAGKSTTIKILMGLIFADRGEARLFDLPCSHPKARAKVGFVPEQPALYDHLTGAEFLHFAGELYGLSKKNFMEHALKLLEKVGLKEAMDLKLRHYSKGMQQRLVIAQALIANPELIIMDEPLSGLDPIGRMEIMDLIKSLKEEGKTIFFSSHILHDVETVCDRVALIVRGELKFLGKPDNIEETFREEIQKWAKS